MAHSLADKISTILHEFDSRMHAATTLEQLETIRIHFIGRSGVVSSVMDALKQASLEEKRIYGPQVNTLKNHINEELERKKLEFITHLQTQEEKSARAFDVTARIWQPLHGTLHPYTQVIQELEDIFISMGFAVVDGPEIETAEYNFDALNIPADHPAREHHDTFWLNVPGLLLRTHTSNVQARTMRQATTFPIAVFAPGRVFRNEALDASHEFMFPQGEIMFIDKNVSLANLMAIAQSFLQKFFNKQDLKIRVRPGYFPFVEPGLEIDGQCPFCTQGCSVCKRTGWIELLGAGLIHPRVLKAGSIDPEVYSGFAMGFGIARIAMIKYGINDIRVFHSNHLPSLQKF
ncbi:phenylalanine--tRNA ligase subunit alpha [Vermiphilus pyriformis]|nr:MAG: phenylalanine--tRNA ligase subunit alpha [Vermiphilus pyriformis]